MNKWIIDKDYFRFNLAEIHHAYYGVVIMLVSAFLDDAWRLVLFCVGFVVFADDVYQHVCQGRKLFGQSYMSPLARLFLPLYRTKLWKRLVSKFRFLENK